MKASLSVASITDIINRLDAFKSNLDIANENVISTLINKGTTQAELYNARAPQSGLEKSKIIGKITEHGKSGYIALVGDNAVYDEFGTGEEGAADAHPLKGEFGLNPYNSGPYVSTHVNVLTGRHYWIIPPGQYTPGTYVDERGYTEGIPSGKQMYDTSRYIRFIKDSVIEKEFNNAIKKYK